MEELQTQHKFRVSRLTMDLDTPGDMATMPPTPGLVETVVIDPLTGPMTFQYVGTEATQLIRTINTANCSVKSMHKRLLEKLSADGKLPGTVVGVPDAAE